MKSKSDLGRMTSVRKPPPDDEDRQGSTTSVDLPELERRPWTVSSETPRERAP